jgi:predicted nucleotide-binding protein (sugar kinase/HSP70/actin superfamily)
MEAIVTEMGRTDVVVPTKPTSKTKQLGAQHAPEFICTPFKMILGSYIEVLERGAYELVGTLFVDYCRLGYYTPIAELILEDLGYDCEFFYMNFDQPLGFIRELKQRTAGLNYLMAIRAFQIGWIKNRYIDIIDKSLHSFQPVELNKGSALAVADELYRLVVDTRGMSNIRKLPKIIKEKFKKEVDIDKKAKPLKVAVVGELYAVVEPAINLDVLQKLNELGVISYTPISFTRWIDIGSRINFFKRPSFKVACRKARPYVGYRLGGKTQESIGYSIMFKEKKWDGVVHIYPFTCMPEIIVRSIIPQLSRDIDIPILSLVVDEHTGEAGYKTRLEAFIDLLSRRNNGEEE